MNQVERTKHTRAQPHEESRSLWQFVGMQAGIQAEGIRSKTNFFGQEFCFCFTNFKPKCTRVNCFYESAATHLRPILIVAYYLGSRLGKILQLTWGRVDLQRDIIKLRSVDKSERTKIGPRAKKRLHRRYNSVSVGDLLGAASKFNTCIFLGLQKFCRLLKKLERERGFEPPTLALAGRNE